MVLTALVKAHYWDLIVSRDRGCMMHKICKIDILMVIVIWGWCPMRVREHNVQSIPIPFQGRVELMTGIMKASKVDVGWLICWLLPSLYLISYCL